MPEKHPEDQDPRTESDQRSEVGTERPGGDREASEMTADQGSAGATMGDHTSTPKASDVAELEDSLEVLKEMSSGSGEEDSVSRETQLQAQLERIQAEADTNKDKWLRSMAELDNFRKRSHQHLESSLNLARADVLKQVLEVLDNFERAMEAWDQAETSPDENFVKGVRLIQDQLLRVLRENRVEKIESIGEAFDPNLHEAVSQIETDEVQSQHVARVIKEGYRFHKTVLRPALVVVAR
ncbi:nucleotide exchange factor GrpE [bacterium]|nr:MAG: nucleotide exchange factor GrpE [bacterium]